MEKPKNLLWYYGPKINIYLNSHLEKTTQSYTRSTTDNSHFSLIQM